MTTRVIVASLNPAKISAVETAFKEVFPDKEMMFEGISVPSEVADQPMTNEETKLGAENRVKNARSQCEGDYFVGLEAGIDGHFTFAWMVIESGSQRGESRSASLPLPEQAMTGIHQGKELGDVMDEMFSQTNVKQKGGAIAMLTDGKLTRSSVYHQALILALIPFINPSLFASELAN
ncbi:inosine/xanthosine triphosphatase [Veronia pacifica]|uniref:Inosine/xanthosine triphosphatase n=1 Tax=Veronia pacifica TaxID=1080227 RepID=A0A1C3EK59_9GAMM|nr:inosine/xanthosine triphosphatase [Veronia pacifica]ODA33627.1 inosine/xanthosine triphosphatase [Veronia pacifica]